jgi:hydrogenase/urease accessory protein HupE
MIRRLINFRETSLWLIPIFFLFWVSTVDAHEVRPAYLEIKEVEASRFDVKWKTPLKGGMRLKIDPRLPAHFKTVTPSEVQVLSDAVVKHWQIQSSSGSLEGETITIEGLNVTITDVLMHLEFRDGRSYSSILKPSESSFLVPEKETTIKIAWTYLVLGIRHILGGIDHLLFILALLLLVRRMGLLLKTITAFTLAHSITLAGAVLGFVQVPAAPVEAVIALSILFLAAELAHGRQGKERLTERYPWVVAFTFGLLHGFGFAGALSEVGLPQNEIPLALFQFNVGVEIGQIMFVTLIVLIAKAIRKIRHRWPRWARLGPAYFIGSVAAFWCIQRTLSFW